METKFQVLQDELKKLRIRRQVRDTVWTSVMLFGTVVVLYMMIGGSI